MQFGEARKGQAGSGGAQERPRRGLGEAQERPRRARKFQKGPGWPRPGSEEAKERPRAGPGEAQEGQEIPERARLAQAKERPRTGQGEAQEGQESLGKSICPDLDAKIKSSSFFELQILYPRTRFNSERPDRARQSQERGRAVHAA